MKPPIILASSSKARSRILNMCGINHKILISNAPEIMNQSKSPQYNAIFNATLKAKTISKKIKSGIIIGADTIVLLRKRLIGKPQDNKEAKALLREFSGKTISVYTGLCVIDTRQKNMKKAFAVTKVNVKRLKDSDINTFLKILGPADKAGGFSIEGIGSLIFDDIEGSFYNVVGLPTTTLFDLFNKLKLNLINYVKR